MRCSRLFGCLMLISALFLLCGCAAFSANPAARMMEEQARKDAPFSAAMASGNPSNCASLAQDDANRCYARFGHMKENVTLCDKSGPDYRDSCISDIAQKTNNTDFCSNIASAESKDRCMLQVFMLYDDAAICAKMSGSRTRDYCYSSVAAYRKNASFCDNVIDLSMKSDCLGYADNATENNTN